MSATMEQMEEEVQKLTEHVKQCSRLESMARLKFEHSADELQQFDDADPIHVKINEVNWYTSSINMLHAKIAQINAIRTKAVVELDILISESRKRIDEDV